ncbi:hypothetical protein KAR91_04675 [Candidatus Pacearchaeota archaeon]|nr:hypothetical protein [Candidatus Pacearchaeota archaeon]
MKVACCDCEHCEYSEGNVILSGEDKGEYSKCWVEQITGWNPVTGLTYIKFSYCKRKNSEGDCKDYEPKKNRQKKQRKTWAAKLRDFLYR